MRNKKMREIAKVIYENLRKIICGPRYRLLEYGEPDTNEIFELLGGGSKILAIGTGPNDPSLEFSCEGFSVEPGKEVIIVKRLRKHFQDPKDQHYNTDFFALVPTTRKIILRMPVADLFREHVIKPEELDNLLQSDYWPKNKSGKTQELYSECKAPEVKLKLKENNNS